MKYFVSILIALILTNLGTASLRSPAPLSGPQSAAVAAQDIVQEVESILQMQAAPPHLQVASWEQIQSALHLCVNRYTEYLLRLVSLLDSLLKTAA